MTDPEKHPYCITPSSEDSTTEDHLIWLLCKTEQAVTMQWTILATGSREEMTALIRMHNSDSPVIEILGKRIDVCQAKITN